MTFPELSCVRLTRAVPDQGLAAGARGTVVYVGAHGGTYEVEFVDPDTGRTIAVVTLADADLRPA
ncbi:MAG: DUF4926 domain-containing protein [Mycobacterium sp.]|jgi:hypothetical protein|nr:DUF4926 domain-containing protein [Mycobacterium sp.]